MTDTDARAARTGALGPVATAPGAAPPDTSACPGCGAVLVVVPGLAGAHPGASAGCAELFRVSVRGLRDEAARDAGAAGLLRLATTAYDAQHQVRDAVPVAPVRLCLLLERGDDPRSAAVPDDRLAEVAPRSVTPPPRWTTTVADLAADLDVVDLPTLVRSWAGAVWTDWSPAAGPLRAAAGRALSG
ncbi:DUF5946 family protein [Modestobacter sp. I12A-02662]|uniref:DUF5946 family protein n=1 Tax=Modestobacter sp. I12A-02662 TaxID=1730496 RepID=UPI0034E03EF2